MYVIIAGGGIIGQGLAQRLIESRHEVVVIDIDPRRCEEIYAKYGAVTINDNVTNLETLESAKIEQCDVAIAVLKNDADNLAFALLAKHFNVPQVLVRMNDSKYKDVYASVGVEGIINRTEILIDQFMVSVENPELRRVVAINDVDISVLTIEDKAKTIGKTVFEITKHPAFPKDVLIICAIEKDTNEYTIPKGDYQIKSQDQLFLCGFKQDIAKAAKLIN